MKHISKEREIDLMTKVSGNLFVTPQKLKFHRSRNSSFLANERQKTNATPLIVGHLNWPHVCRWKEVDEPKLPSAGNESSG